MPAADSYASAAEDENYRAAIAASAHDEELDVADYCRKVGFASDFCDGTACGDCGGSLERHATDGSQGKCLNLGIRKCLEGASEEELEHAAQMAAYSNTPENAGLQQAGLPRVSKMLPQLAIFSMGVNEHGRLISTPVNRNNTGHSAFLVIQLQLKHFQGEVTTRTPHAWIFCCKKKSCTDKRLQAARKSLAASKTLTGDSGNWCACLLFPTPHFSFRGITITLEPLSYSTGTASD
jgi:hypothetical protein